MICEQTVVSASGLLLTEQEVDAAAAVLRQGAFGKPTDKQTNKQKSRQAGRQAGREAKKQEETTYGVEEKPWQKTNEQTKQSKRIQLVLLVVVRLR